jgi:hypothetical protein
MVPAGDHRALDYASVSQFEPPVERQLTRLFSWHSGVMCGMFRGFSAKDQLPEQLCSCADFCLTSLEAYEAKRWPLGKDPNVTGGKG